MDLENEELILKNQRLIMEYLRFSTDNEWLQTNLGKQIEYTSERIKEFKIERKIELEAELESQKEMNAILTEELGLNNKC